MHRIPSNALQSISKTEITAFEAEEDEESEGPALEPAPGLMDGGRTQYPREHE